MASPTSVVADLVTGGGAPSSVEINLYNKVISDLRPGNPLRGTALELLSAAHKYNVDPRLLLAIAGQETEWGTTGGATQIHNPFGMGPGINYPSWGAAYEAAAKNLRENYLDQGKTTIPAIGAKWAPVGAGNDPRGLNSNWPKGVASIYAKLGGDPVTGDLTWTKTGVPGQGVVGDLQDVAGNVTNIPGIREIAAVLKFLADPALWLRIGTMVLGLISLVLGFVFMMKGSGKSARPVGLLVALFGFGWLWAGVKNVDPITLARDVVGAS